LKLHWQPILALSTGEPVGLEALVRYVDREGNVVLPGEFLGAADESGLIVDVGTWVATEAAVSVAKLRRMGVGPDGLFASINVSARQLSLDDVAALVEHALDTTSLPPEALWVEISEAAANDAELRADALHRLAADGVHVGLDDFGTGYGTLSSLRDLPVSFVKIDGSFVAGLGRNHADEVIVASIIAMAGALGISVIAEGIETHYQLAALEALGCPLGQGWLWGRPAPLPEILGTLTGRRAPRQR
jgi:EAL domain-containing protein (putative c-di-GMP-specific phosphodiesterase class I)